MKTQVSKAGGHLKVSLERAHRERWRSVSQLAQTGHLRRVYSFPSLTVLEERGCGSSIAHQPRLYVAQLFCFLNTGAKGKLSSVTAECPLERSSYLGRHRVGSHAVNGCRGDGERPQSTPPG
ncbi:unnamed protein product [Arctogadus glacialis]